MRRLHLFEWQDQWWLPTVFRDFVTDHLRFTLSSGVRRPINRSIAERLAKLLRQSGNDRIIDLCSGAGGPLLRIRRVLEDELDLKVEVVLTDLYPNIEALKRREAEGGGAVIARYESTSAFDVPKELSGIRTVFTALHHFRPEDARKILADAVRKRQPIAIFESQERTLESITSVSITFLRLSFLHTPKVGPMTASRFFFTYIIPLAPIILLWDGLVSCVRTYTPQELRNLADAVNSENYSWEAGRFEHPGPFGFTMPTIYLIGTPVAA